MKNYISILSIIAVFATPSLYAQNFANGFNFNLPPFDSTTSAYLPTFPAKTIGEADRVTVKNGHFSVNNKPTRFWGVNVVAGGAFPSKDKARLIAARMRKMGINLVRFHHLDNAWGSNEASIFIQNQSTRSLNPTTLDRLDFFIAQLKQENIYVNMNLNVARTFRASDGVANADSLPEFAKAVTLFDPILEVLQREYAQQLLNHVNPYTGLALSKDPVLAVVEMNNENTIYGAWKDEWLKPAAQGGKIIYRQSAYLDSLWNAFLLKKYTNQTTLYTQYTEGVSPNAYPELVQNGGFETAITNPWFLELHNVAQATATQDASQRTEGSYAAKLNVTNVSTEDWHIQFKNTGFSLKKDSFYTIKFAAKADRNTTISATLMRDNDPYTWYAGQQFNVTTQWQVFTMAAKASEDNMGYGRLSFGTNKNAGVFWFDAVSIKQVQPIGLEPDENLTQRTVRRVNWQDRYKFTNIRVGDMAEFYIDLEKKHFDSLRLYLKNTLGVTAAITGSNALVGTAGAAVHTGMDYLDDHNYWDHPQFPGAAWDASNWLINNLPLVKNPQYYGIANIFSGLRLADKPYTISEYNHAAPNRFRTEMPTSFTAYSSLHGCDGVMFFDYNGENEWETDRMNGFFSLHRDNSIMGLFPSCAFAFRNNLVAEDPQPIEISYTNTFLRNSPKTDFNGRWQPSLPYDSRLGLTKKVQTKTYSAVATTNFAALPVPVGNRLMTATNETILDTDKGLLQTATPQYISVSGFLNDNPNTQIGGLRLLNASEFGALTWLSLDNQPLISSKKSLLTISTNQQNTNMQWVGTSSVGANWGSAPTLQAPTIVNLRLSIAADSVFLIALDPMGRAKTQTKILPSAAQTFDISLNQTQDKTLWYALQTTRVQRVGLGDPSVKTGFFAVFPNPVEQNILNYKYELTTSSSVRLEIYNALGQLLLSKDEGEKAEGLHQSVVSVANFTEGVYFAVLKTGNYQNKVTFMVGK
jgi:Carbohydrate binding domain/Secretion system C-terminal sorting domain